ncbi:MAG: ATP-binding protein [Kiritimatiellae bacterium]|nr:ATP-binding protein [Kiritimatiellia bacterium]
MKAEENRLDKTMRIDIEPFAVDAGVRVAVPVPQRSRSRTWRSRTLLKRDTPFYKLLESVYDAVLITTRAGEILECNERAAEFFLMAPQTLTGREVLSLISGATESLLETINKNLVSKKYTLVEARCKRSDGTSFAAEIAVNKVDLDAQGQLCFFVRDITVRQQAQSALEDAVERLQAHDRARMEFVSNVSHELRTPLTSMIYAVSNMLRGVVGPMPEKALLYLERLQSDCHRLLATVNDILDLRQVENKTLVLTKKVVPLGIVIREGAETLQVQADSKRIAVRFDFGERELFCWCDAQKIERVVLNIVGNAVKFTPANGEISISLAQHPAKPKLALLTVSDTGMGIPPEMLPRVSQRYFRVGDHVSGSGLGLAISREIVELHGGSMEFASPVPGTACGTAVYVSLPLAPKPLVVAYSRDDETSAFLKARIMGQGYGLAFADSAKEALEFCLSRQPCVFVLDSRVADMEVRDIVLRVREESRTKRLPVIVLGLKALERNEIELYRHFDIFYCKLPWREKDLVNSLAMAVLGKLR